MLSESGWTTPWKIVKNEYDEYYIRNTNLVPFHQKAGGTVTVFVEVHGSEVVARIHPDEMIFILTEDNFYGYQPVTIQIDGTMPSTDCNQVVN